MKKIILIVILAIVLVLPTTLKAQAPFLSGYGGAGFAGYVVFFGQFSNTSACPDTVTYVINSEAHSILSYRETKSFVTCSYMFEDTFFAPGGDTIVGFLTINNEYGVYYDTFAYIVQFPAGITEQSADLPNVWCANKSVFYENVPEHSVMKITNILGQTTTSFEISDAKGKVDVYQLKPGIYIVSLENSETKISNTKIYIE